MDFVRLRSGDLDTPIFEPIIQRGQRMSFDYVMGIPALAALLNPILDEGAAVARKAAASQMAFRPNIHAVHHHIKAAVVAEHIWVSIPSEEEMVLSGYVYADR